MIIGIIGENCSGKSTLAKKIQTDLDGQIITGRDYLKLAKSESEATALFKEKLKNAQNGDNIIYVISEKEQVALLPDGTVKILVCADLETIKERFKKRMHGNLPQPVAQMLEKKHGMFDSGDYDFRYDGVDGDADEICKLLSEYGKEQK
jgi:adenylate kinase family enzyme